MEIVMCKFLVNEKKFFFQTNLATLHLYFFRDLIYNTVNEFDECLL